MTRDELELEIYDLMNKTRKVLWMGMDQAELDKRLELLEDARNALLELSLLDELEFSD